MSVRDLIEHLKPSAELTKGLDLLDSVILGKPIDSICLHCFTKHRMRDYCEQKIQLIESLPPDQQFQVVAGPEVENIYMRWDDYDEGLRRIMITPAEQIQFLHKIHERGGQQ